jgi:hypothetical protein
MKISSPACQYSQRVYTLPGAIVQFSLAIKLIFATASFLLAPTNKMVVDKKNVHKSIIIKLIKSLRENNKQDISQCNNKKQICLGGFKTSLNETETSHKRYLVETLLKNIFVG